MVELVKKTRLFFNQSVICFIIFSLSSILILSTFSINTAYAGKSLYKEILQGATRSKQGDLWGRIQSEFVLPSHIDNEAVQAHIRYFAAHPAYLNRVINRATPYLYMIMDELDKRGLPGELALLPMIESAFNPYAISHAGAAGIWQLMPQTARHYGIKQDWWYDGRFDIPASTNAALDYLANLSTMFNGDYLLAIAAYNVGEGRIQREVKKNQAAGKKSRFWDLRLPRETQEYVPKLLALKAIIENPERYQVSLPKMRNSPLLKHVQLSSQIDLNYAAMLANMSVNDLVKLNPGYNRWSTHPNGPHNLLMPIHNANTFSRKFKTTSEDERVTWKRYHVQPGDSLPAIAKSNHVTIESLKKANKMDTDTVESGKYLVIPSSAKSKDLAKAPTQLAKAPAASTANAAPKRSRAPLTNAEVVYVVKRGDSIARIAKRYDVEPQQVAEWNRLNKRTVIQPGQKIVIKI